VSFFWWKFACCSEYWDELLRKYVDNVFCIVSRNIRCDLKNTIQICLLLRLFVMIRFRDHAWSSHRQFFWLFSLAFDEWRMLILDYRVTYICSRLVERRLWWDVIKLDETSHQTHCERLIKLDESDSSKLTTSSHQIWRKRFIKFDDVISSNLMKAIHQTWRRHLIKFLKRKTVSLLFDERSHAATRDMKNLILQKITFVLCKDKCLCEIVMINERS
jgi:hypothetical protein